MPRGTVVKVDRVMPFSPPGAEDTYVSRMLIDASNSGSERLQINHGVVKAGRRLPGAAHPPPYDEIYYVLSGQAVLNMDGVDYDPSLLLWRPFSRPKNFPLLRDCSVNVEMRK